MKHAMALAMGAAVMWSGLACAAPAAKPAVPADDPSLFRPGAPYPKNAMGQVDLSGYWSNATLTPLVRNARLTPGPTIPAAQAKQMEKIWAEAQEESVKPTDPKVSTEEFQKNSTDSKLIAINPIFAAAGGGVGGYNGFWLDPGNHVLEVNGEYRTSIITTSNGLPPARKGGGSGMPRYRDVYDNPENRSAGERCISSFGRNAPPPMLPNGFYNNGYYFIQTPDTVAIQVELIHDVRVVRLNSKHRTDGVRPSMGDSIGWYEGPTLVVETTNFPEADGFMGSWNNLKVTERFTRVSPTRINYQFTVEDPEAWDKPWGGEYQFYPMTGRIYEYACHEGNYALRHILAGARKQEETKGKAGS